MLKRNRGRHAGRPRDGLEVPPPPRPGIRLRRYKEEASQARPAALRGQARRDVILEARVRQIITHVQFSQMLSLCRELEDPEAPAAPAPEAPPPEPHGQRHSGTGWPARPPRNEYEALASLSQAAAGAAVGIPGW